MVELNTNLPSQTQVSEQVAEKGTPKTNAKKVNTDTRIIASARKGFDLVPDGMKSNALKLAFLRKAASSIPDMQKFHGRFMSEAESVKERIADSVSIVKACESEGIDLFTLATHILFMGKTKVQQVFKYSLGERSPLRGQLSLFKEAFMPTDAQDFVNPNWLPSNDGD